MIFHLFATASFPNFRSYHSLVFEAVTARLVDTKMNAVNIVLFITVPAGADIIAKDK